MLFVEGNGGGIRRDACSCQNVRLEVDRELGEVLGKDESEGPMGFRLLPVDGHVFDGGVELRGGVDGEAIVGG